MLRTVPVHPSVLLQRLDLGHHREDRTSRIPDASEGVS